jgi:predicted RNase H-like HicB family nuclease
VIQPDPTHHYLTAPYSRIVIPDPDSGTFTAQVMEFPGCVAQGDSVAEAYANLESAAERWIEAALELGQRIPEPAAAQRYSGRVLVRFPKSLHRRAAEAAARDGTSLNQFVVAAVAERVGGLR